MLQNIKVDMIYYKSPADFEMEFNLCGCCRMRLLTDKVQDKKSFVNSLSRAVSRSKVIICSGSLFGEENLIEMVSGAVGMPLEVLDNETFGISYDSEIKIIKGALPLVTEEGIFGGCIIESGPQSIILLSGSKGVRKSIMSSLVHSYISEMSIVREGAAESCEQPAEDTAPIETEEIAATAESIEPAELQSEQEEETVAEETAEEMPAEDVASQEAEAENSFPQEEDEIELFIEPQRLRFSKKNYYDTDYGCVGQNELFVVGEPLEEKPRSMKIPVIILSVILALAVIVLLYFAVFIPLREGYSLPEYLETVFTVSEKATKFLIWK